MVLDKDGTARSELKLYSFPQLPPDSSNKDIKHSCSPHSPSVKEEDSEASRSGGDPTVLTPHQKRAIYEGVDSHRSSMAALPEYQLSGRFRQYAVIADKSDPDNKARKDSLAAQTERGSYLAPVETESGDYAQGQEEPKPVLQQPGKPRAHLLAKARPTHQAAPRRDPFSTSFLVAHRQARKAQPGAYRRAKRSVTGFSSTSRPSQKSSLHRS